MGGRTGPVFYIYYEGMRHPPPILTRKKEFDLSKRKHGPTIVPALSAKVDNKENDSFRLETHCSSPSSSTHSAPAAGFSISAWPWRAAEGRISFFHKRTQKVRDRAFQPAEAHQRAGSCPFYQSLFRKANTRAKPI